MDTKSKNTKSFGLKFICIVLSIIMAAIASGLVFNIISVASFYNRNAFDKQEFAKMNFTDSSSFVSDFYSDLSDLINATTLKNQNELYDYIKSRKNDCINNAFEDFKVKQQEVMDYYDVNTLAQLKELFESEDFYIDEEDQENIYFNSNYTDDYDIKYKGNTFTPYYNNSLSVRFDQSDKSVRAALIKAFDDNLEEFMSNMFPEETGNNYLVSTNNIKEINGLKYYVKNSENKKVITNLKNGESYKDIEGKDYSLIIKNGSVVSNKLNADSEFLPSSFGKNIQAYVYIDQTNDPGNKYAAIINFDQQAHNDSSISLITQVVIVAVLAAISLGLLIYSLIICGVRLENGKVKRAFIDYIPSDIHFVISAALIGGIIILLNFEVDIEFFDYFKTIRVAFSAACGVIWALALENFTSFVRVCKSDKKLYKNLLLVWIAYGLYKLIKLILKPIKKLFSNLKKACEYKPVNFQKRLIFFIVGYALINLILVASIIFWFFVEVFILGFVSSFLMLALNAASAAFVVKYVVNLDRIITAAHNRTMPQVNYNNLPQSLKFLVNSLRYTNQELNAAVNKAVRDERMRTELITNVSHDLKTPLTSIINYVDLLSQSNIQDEKAREYIGVLDEKGKKLKRLVDDLIEASKVTSGVITLNRVNLNLNELATQAIVESQQDFINNNLDLIFKGDKSNVVAFADGNKTYRILENLLSNARKYSAKGTRVYADVYETQQYAVFEIKNISAEALDISPDELTERFVRGDKSRTNEGNGLGLSIAKELCKAQNGVLDITIDGDLFKARVLLPKENRK